MTNKKVREGADARHAYMKRITREAAIESGQPLNSFLISLDEQYPELSADEEFRTLISDFCSASLDQSTLPGLLVRHWRCTYRHYGKKVSPDEVLMLASRVINCRVDFASRSSLDFVSEAFDLSRQSGSLKQFGISPRTKGLTTTQERILEEIPRLVKQHGEGPSAAEIGNRVGVSDRAVRNAIKKMPAGLVKWKRGAGYSIDGGSS